LYTIENPIVRISRLTSPPHRDSDQGRTSFLFNGTVIQGYAGEPVAMALRRAGVLVLGRSPIDGTPRGAFCFMGVCQECRIRAADGHIAYACRLPVQANLRLTSDV